MQPKLYFATLATLLLATGCLGPPKRPAEPLVMLENPLVVPVGRDSEFVWNQLVDTVDDFFRIRSEQRIQDPRTAPTEGRIDTYPQVGSTIFEPWRGDSTKGFERWHATLQTVRRRAIVRVIPQQAVWAVEVQVLKEMEDLSQPQHAGVGRAAHRHDGGLVRLDPKGSIGPAPLGWYSVGRDTTLEQKILAQIQARLNKFQAEH